MTTTVKVIVPANHSWDVKVSITQKTCDENHVIKSTDKQQEVEFTLWNDRVLTCTEIAKSGE